MPDVPLPDLTNRVAFITGGSSGIGLGIAQACRERGMRVVFTYRSEQHRDQALALLGPPGEGLAARYLKVEDRQAWHETALWMDRTMGPPDLLVANAGMGTNVRIREATFQDWDTCLSTNLGGVINTLNFMLPRMLARGGGGHVVLTASMSGLMPVGQSGVYTTSKFAVVGMAEALRGELCGLGIGVSAFCPGMVRSRIGIPQREGAPYHQVGMEPLECGHRVLDGVLSNSLYILTHPEFEPGVAERKKAVLASFPQADSPRPWWEHEKGVLRSPIYAPEIERLLGDADPQGAVSQNSAGAAAGEAGELSTPAE